jgi:hypothetical protein
MTWLLSRYKVPLSRDTCCVRYEAECGLLFTTFVRCKRNARMKSPISVTGRCEWIGMPIVG